jgi:putative redox protein
MALIATVQVRGDTKYATTMAANGHALTADEHVSAGGTNTGPTPMELLLASLGSCSSITLRMYADRKGWELGHIGVALRLFRDRDGEVVKTRIERDVSFSAPVTAEQRARLLEIVEKTPVTLLIKQGVPIATQSIP